MSLIEVAKQVYDIVKTPGDLSTIQYQELIAALAAFFTGVALIAEDKKQADDQLPVMRNSLTIISKLTNKKLPELENVKTSTIKQKKKGAYEVLEVIAGGYEPVDATTIVLPDIIGGVQHIKLGTDVIGLYNDLRQRYELIRNDLASGQSVDDNMYVNMTGYTAKELDELQLTESEFVKHLWSQRSSSTNIAQEKAENVIRGKVKTKLPNCNFDYALEGVQHLVHIYNKAEQKLLSKIIETEFDNVDGIYEPAQARIKLDELSALVTIIESEIVKIQAHKEKRKFLANINISDFTVKVQLKPLSEHPVTGLEKYYTKALHYKDMLLQTEAKHVAYCQLLEKIVESLDVFDVMYTNVAKALTIAIAMMHVCDRTILQNHKTTAETLFSRLNTKFSVPSNVYVDGLDVSGLIDVLTSI